jgi:OOP family OmpA-OmpF porin
MTSIFKSIKSIWMIVLLFSSSLMSFSQGDQGTIIAQFALGFNSPSSSGFVDDFEANSINFPSINLGLQYMFMPKLGAKLDFGYNRFSETGDSPEFKVNYSRFNAQLVYNLSNIIPLNRIGTFIHAGPGITMISPLGNYVENNTSYLNTMAGIELHYGVSDKLSVYLDTSYIFGFAKDFNPILDGYGSFNGNLLTVAIGASISLSGCYYCGDR